MARGISFDSAMLDDADALFDMFINAIEQTIKGEERIYELLENGIRSVVAVAGNADPLKDKIQLR